MHSVVRHQGCEYQVEGIVTFHLPARSLTLVCLAGVTGTRWLEPPPDELHDRVLLLHDISGLDISTPPPTNVCFRGLPYLPVLAGPAQAAVEGRAPGRTSGPCELWRYRAAGDLYLHMERWPSGEFVLAGASVHRSMLEIAPG